MDSLAPYPDVAEQAPPSSGRQKWSLSLLSHRRMVVCPLHSLVKKHKQVQLRSSSSYCIGERQCLCDQADRLHPSTVFICRSTILPGYSRVFIYRNKHTNRAGRKGERHMHRIALWPFWLEANRASKLTPILSPSLYLI